MNRTAHPEYIARDNPDKVAFVLADTGEALTYGELCADANRLARAFRAAGLGPGDVVACLLQNGPDVWRVAWAAKNSGLRYVMIGTRLNGADAGFIVRDSGAKLLVTETQFAGLRAQSGYLTDGPPVIFADRPASEPMSLAGIMSRQPAVPLSERTRGASMLYSSGTSGRPKGVRAILAGVPPEVPSVRHALLLERFALDAQSVFLTPAPFYHAAPLRISMAVQRTGGTVIGFRRFDALSALEGLRHYRATHAFFVPTIFQRMLGLPAEVRAAAELPALRHAIHGAAPCPPHVKRAMAADPLQMSTQSGVCPCTAEERPGQAGEALVSP